MTLSFSQRFPFFPAFILVTLVLFLLILLYVGRRTLLGLAIEYNFTNRLFCSDHSCAENELSFPKEAIHTPFISLNATMLRHCLRMIHTAYQKNNSASSDFPSIYQTLWIIPNRFDDNRPIGYILLDTKSTVLWIVYRGSMDYKDIEKDVNMKQSLFLAPDKKVHRGFLLIYHTFRVSMLQRVQHFLFTYLPRHIVITGHSLGGALSILSTADLAFMCPSHFQITTYTFGCPRVGNLALVHYLRQQNQVTCYRIANSEDIFTNIPLSVTLSVFRPRSPFQYSHYGIPLVFADNRQNYTTTHSLLTYIQNVPSLIRPCDRQGGPYQIEK